MMKIDRETFEFQMQLVKSEIKVEQLTNELLLFKEQLGVAQRHANYAEARARELQDELEMERRSNKEYIERFIQKQP